MPRDPRKVGFRVKGLGVPKSRGSFWKGPHSKDDRIFEGFISLYWNPPCFGKL